MSHWRAQPNGMTKHAAATLFDPASGLEQPRALDFLQNHQELTGGDHRDGARAELRKDMLLQETPVPLDRRGGEGALVDASLEDLQPGSGDRFKRVGVARAHPATFGAGVDAASEEAPGIRVEASCLCEADFGIDPQRKSCCPSRRNGNGSASAWSPRASPEGAAGDHPSGRKAFPEDAPLRYSGG
jgi:hypothetical protein